MNRIAWLSAAATLVVSGLLATALPTASGWAPRPATQTPPPQLPPPAVGGKAAKIGQPTSTATVTFTIEVSYLDAQGKKQTQKFEANVSVKPANPDNPPPADGGPADHPFEKAQAFADGLNDAILDHAAAKGWPVGLAVASAFGDILTIAPGANPATGEYSNVEIKKLKSSEERTGQKDEILKGSALALGEVAISGDITGLVDGAAGSWLWVGTNLGEIQIPLNAQMRRVGLMQEVRDQLAGLGVVAWHERERDVVLLLMDEEVSSLGVSSNDDGLRVSASVHFP